MDRYSNCYRNSAYNRTLDDFDDFADDNDSHVSYGSTENEICVDDFIDDVRSSYSEDIRCPLNLAANRTINLPIPPPVGRSTIKSYLNDPLTSTPKKQPVSTFCATIRTPRRRPPIARSRSFSTPTRREIMHARFSKPDPRAAYPLMQRSQSSLNLRVKYPEYFTPNQVRCSNRNCLDNCELRAYYASVLQSEFPFQSRRAQFLHRPYDNNNSSFSSTRPLISRNTAIISPINYTKTTEPDITKDDDGMKEISRAFTIAADRSPSSKGESWFEMKKPSMPKCTLRTSGFTLLVSGVLSCLLCFHIMACKGKGLEIILSLISGFIIMCLGFTCLWIQQWQWFPNRNYVSGHILLSVFSVFQSACLWLVDQYQFLPSELVDVMRGALYGLSSLTMTIASLGLCTSCCCKHPPPDNRVGHAVQGFTV